MYYKINLDDDSYIIADENYKLSLFYMAFIKKVVTVKEYLADPNLKKYHLVDLVHGNKINRDFTIEEVEGEPEQPIGSRLKLAQYIQPEDLVMGIDGNPRTVDHLHRGQDEMYEIECNGKKYTVNGGHILELVDIDTNETLEIQVDVFMQMTEEFKSHYRMLSVITEDQNKESAK